jgi:hypothetical protein
MYIFRKTLIMVLAALLFVLLTFSSAFAYTHVVHSSSCYKYMQKHRGSGEKSKRIKAIQQYFCIKNPKLASKTARTYAILVERRSRKDKLDPFLVASIIVKESTVNRLANSGRSYGLMQVNWNANKSWIKKVFPKVRSRKDLYRSAKNIDVGCYILKKALERSGGNVDRALDRYRGKSLISYRKKVLAHYCSIVKLFRKK